MATVSKISDKWVLVVDDMEGMRSQLRMALSSAGFAKLHVVGSIKDALEKLKENHYHVILCDYSLGDGTDGQQFLEYLRTNDLIRRNTIFVMITAEQAYEKVVAASECAPDDYLLKPFTAAQFSLRLEKLLDRQAYFLPIDQASDRKHWAGVVAECDKLLIKKDKFYFDLCKIKGAALMRDNQPQQAATLFTELLALRNIAWAKLGLARALARQGKQAEASQLARELLAENPQFMAAYDFLARMMSDTGDKPAALAVLQQAREIAPGTMSRIRELSSLAVSTGQPEIAEKVMRETLNRHKYSPVRKADDYAVLSQALLQQGKAEQALGVMQDARKSFTDPHSHVLFAATECRAHHLAGNREQAVAALEQALAANVYSVDAVLALADACLALGREEQAMSLLRQTVQNHHEDSAVKSRVRTLMIAAGKEETEADALVEDCTNEVTQLNNEGVRRAQAGQLAEAIALLCEAAERLPNNLQILGNAALVLALDQVRNGRKADKLALCLSYRERLSQKSPGHPKIEQINNIIKKLA